MAYKIILILGIIIPGRQRLLALVGSMSRKKISPILKLGHLSDNLSSGQQLHPHVVIG